MMGHRRAALCSVVAVTLGAVTGGAVPAAAKAGGEVGGAGRWRTPTCTTVVGTDAVTFTSDGGRTLAPAASASDSAAPTFGLVALDEANVLYAEHEGVILRSDDAGCAWHPIGEVEGAVRLVAGPGGRAYGHGDSGGGLVRIEGATVTPLPTPAAEIVGLGVDPADRDHLRLGGSDGSLWESSDGGTSFELVATAPLADFEPRPARRLAVDPANFDHIVLGGVHFGVLVTFDGGRTWTRSAGLLPGDADWVNVISVAMTPDGTTVWINGLVSKRIRPGEIRTDRHIFRSTDGARSFSAVLSGKEVTILNVPAMAAHPTDPDVVHFSGANSELHRFNAATGTVTTAENGHFGIDAMAFSPADPDVLYLGVRRLRPYTAQ